MGSSSNMNQQNCFLESGLVRSIIMVYFGGLIHLINCPSSYIVLLFPVVIIKARQPGVSICCIKGYLPSFSCRSFKGDILISTRFNAVAVKSIFTSKTHAPLRRSSTHNLWVFPEVSSLNICRGLLRAIAPASYN